MEEDDDVVGGGGGGAIKIKFKRKREDAGETEGEAEAEAEAEARVKLPSMGAKVKDEQEKEKMKMKLKGKGKGKGKMKVKVNVKDKDDDVVVDDIDDIDMDMEMDIVPDMDVVDVDVVQQQQQPQQQQLNHNNNHNPYRHVVLSETRDAAEVFPGKGVRVQGFPAVLRQRMVRPHQSLLNLAAADRGELLDDRSRATLPLLENISHGHIQVLSTTPLDDVDKLEPVGLLEFKGVVKSFSIPGQNGQRECSCAFPMHADWFLFSDVNKLEYQVVPEYFSGKFSELTPHKYIEIRNFIVTKYLENPERALSLNDIQGLRNVDMKHVATIFEFLDRWGIINYCAIRDLTNNSYPDSKEALQERANGEVHISPGSLRTIESLIQFDPPRSRSKAADVSESSGCSSSAVADLDCRIQERLSEHRCTYCSSVCSEIMYQSQKETDIVLCLECFSDGKPVIGMATVDFVRVDSMKDMTDADGNTWSNQETLLLLEAIEIFGDNWNAIAEHVGTKSKAQCMLHFIRLPMETDLLDNIDMPDCRVISDDCKEVEIVKGTSMGDKVNGDSVADLELENRIVFANSGNPVMALIAFLASAVGPRVAAACAHAALVVLSKTDCTIDIVDEKFRGKDGNTAVHRLKMENNSLEDGNQEVIASSTENRVSPLSAEKVRLAAMAGLSAAAVKAKLFADQEEHEIQRLTASIIANQLKRLDTKLKQFGEIESVLLKECEQVERARQKLFTDRTRFISNQMVAAGSTCLGVGSVTTTLPINSRPVMPCTMPAAPHPSFAPSQHPAMPFMARPSMFPFGHAAGGVAGSSVPLPMSTIQSLSSGAGAGAGAPASVLIGTSTPNSNSNSTVTHNMLRPVSGTNTPTN